MDLHKLQVMKPSVGPFNYSNVEHRTFSNMEMEEAGLQGAKPTCLRVVFMKARVWTA